MENELQKMCIYMQVYMYIRVVHKKKVLQKCSSWSMLKFWLQNDPIPIFSSFENVLGVAQTQGSSQAVG